MERAASGTRQPKQARAIRTRARILDQAAQAFATKGFEATSLTSDILEPADVSVGSFYHQFADKHAVLLTLVEDRRAAWSPLIEQLVTSRSHATLQDALRAWVIAQLDDVDEHPAIWWIAFREMYHADPAIRQVFDAGWSEWVEQLRRLTRPWAGDDCGCDDGLLRFVANGIAGVVRRYLVADGAVRTLIRECGVDEAVRAAAAALQPVS